jgi:hypothetical protein
MKGQQIESARMGATLMRGFIVPSDLCATARCPYSTV